MIFLKMADESSVLSQYPFVITICTLGFLSLSKTLLKFLKWVWSILLRPSKNLTSYGSFALITGCTDGIGKALAFELASNGLNLVLVGRNPQKLQSTSNEIWETYGKQIRIKILVVDFEKHGGEEIELKIRTGIEGLDVGVLVNNVGLANGASFFHEADLKAIVSLMDVNIGTVTWVTRAVLPGMLKNKKGAIVNVGSGSSAALPSYPLFTVYASTKAYVAMFSRCLSVEYQQYGIDIQCQIPMLVATKMTSIAIKKTSFFVPSPKVFSRACVRWIGYDIICIPYWTHALQCFLMNAIPASVLNSMILRAFLNVRKKVLQKEAMSSSLNQKS